MRQHHTNSNAHNWMNSRFAELKWAVMCREKKPLRIGDPTFPMPVVLGMMALGGLYLRDVRLRALIPLRR
jgi:hypothetical protein